MRNQRFMFLLAVLFIGLYAVRIQANVRTWMTEAESSPRGWSEVASAIKDPDASGGVARVCYPATSRRSSVAFEGPMTMDQPPGIYRAAFRLKVEDNTNPETVARLSIWQEGLGVFASRDVKANEFRASGKYEEFDVEFTRVPGGMVACYINWLGGYGDTTEPLGTPLWLDKVTLKQVHAFSPREINERFPDAWKPAQHARPTRSGPIRVLIVRGPQYPWFKIEEALSLLPVAEIRRCNFRSLLISGDFQVTGSFPVTREEMFNFDVVVLVDVDAHALGVQRRQLINDFVRAGGGLLTCGGPFAYGKGRYEKTELEDVLPVLSNGPWDWKSTPKPVTPGTQHDVTAEVDWESPPYVFWYHTVKLRPESTVVLKAGEDPLLVVGAKGKGRSAALLATALGKANNGETPFWDWPAWRQGMANTLRWLAGRELSAAAATNLDTQSEVISPLLVAETMSNRISLVNAMPAGSNPTSSNEIGLVGGFRRLGRTQPRDLGLSWPCGLATDKQGRIYIADFGHNRILRVDDLVGNGLVELGEYGDQQPPDVPGTLPIHFHMPYGIAIDSKDRIYVADTHNARIVRFDDMSGTNWVDLGHRLRWDAERNHFNWPLGLAVDGQDRIYIADSRNGRIVRIDEMDGSGWTVCDGGTAKHQKFHTPTAVSIASDGAIYVADSGNNRIVRISDMNGSGWQAIEGLDQPVSVAVQADGRVFAGMAHASGVHVFRSIQGDGRHLLSTQSGIRGILALNSHTE